METLHFADEKSKLPIKGLFAWKVPDDRTTACNIRMQLSGRLLVLGLEPDVNWKLIFVSDQRRNIIDCSHLCNKQTR
jgi:hypothetical protein